MLILSFIMFLKKRCWLFESKDLVKNDNYLIKGMKVNKIIDKDKWLFKCG